MLRQCLLPQFAKTRYNVASSVKMELIVVLNGAPWSPARQRRRAKES